MIGCTKPPSLAHVGGLSDAGDIAVANFHEGRRESWLEPCQMQLVEAQLHPPGIGVGCKGILKLLPGHAQPGHAHVLVQRAQAQHLIRTRASDALEPVDDPLDDDPARQ